MDENSTESIAARYERAADELERAARHLRTSAGQARAREGARVGADAFAALGHIRAAQSLVDDLAVLHAARSRAV